MPYQATVQLLCDKRLPEYIIGAYRETANGMHVGRTQARCKWTEAMFVYSARPRLHCIATDKNEETQVASNFTYKQIKAVVEVMQMS